MSGPVLSASSFRIEHDGPVAVFTLDRPGRLNALTKQVYEELRDAFRSAAADDGVGALVLTGANGAFCSGGDVRDVIGSLVTADARDLEAWNRLTADTVAAMRSLGKPIIAAIDGVAAGGGAALALAADLRLGSERARFAFLFSRVGLSAADMGVTWLLPRLVGSGRANELLLFGDAIDAAQAAAWGLLNRVCPADELLAQALSWAKRLAEGPRFATSVTKRALEAAASLDLGAALDAEVVHQTACMQHDDFREGHRAFLEKRPPRFSR